MKNIDKTVLSKTEPRNQNVMWIQPNEQGAQIKAVINGKWELIGRDEDAYRKPVSGIPESDLDESVRDAISNAQHLEGKIDDEIERSKDADTAFDERLGIMEQLAEISISGGDATIATASDFNNPTIAQKAHIPTVGAILDGVDTTLTSGSKKLITSGVVYDEIYPQIGTAQPVGGMLPNVLYELGVLSGSVTFSLAAGTQGIVNHYYWTFDTGDDELTVTWPQEIVKWSEETEPTISTNSHYEVSVLNGVGVYIEI